MKRSIRFRFTTLFIGMLAAVLLAIWVINSFFLEQYYINDKVKILQDAYEQLNDCAVEQALEGRNIIDDLPSFYSKDGEQTEVSRMLRVMNEQYNTTVVLIDSLNDRTFPTFWDNRLLSDLVRQYILGRSMPDTEAIISEENYKIEKRYVVEMTKEQKKVYKTYIDDIKNKMKEKDLTKDKITIFSYLTKLRQLALDPGILVDGYIGGSGKIDVTVDLINEFINTNHKILLFSQFTSVLDSIKTIFDAEGIEYFYLDGSTKASERVSLVNEFNNSNKVKVFLISLKAGGTGLNLTSADVVIHFDPWWNPAIEDQATDRAHRFGQKNVVEVIKLISKGSIEEKIIKLQESKKEIINEIMNGNYTNGGFLSSLDADEIKELFS